MEIKELAGSLEVAKANLADQQRNLKQVQNLVDDLGKEDQTFDIKLEISNLNKDVNSQTTLIEQRQKEIAELEASIALLK
jgi:peptidoglycan hydrolase CwlO-like protein